jgi:L-lysine exporter family protein LysE/ArgO
MEEMPDEGNEAEEVCPEEARVLSPYVYSSLAVALAEAGGGRSLGWLLRGILLGLGAAVPIGPVNVEIARRALRGGFFAGFALGCGAVTVDVLYLLLSSLSVTQLLNEPGVLRWLAAAGALLLTFLGVMSLKSARRHVRSDPLIVEPGQPTKATAHSAYLTGVLMTLLNPMTLAFWFTVVPAQAAGDGGIPKDRAAQLPIIGIGVFIGTIGWVLAFSGLLGWAGRYRKNWWLALADAAGGVMLLAFAGLAFLRLTRPFL